MHTKIFVHHRALNTKENFLNYLNEINSVKDENIYAAEGDLCWFIHNGKPIIYIYHPTLTGNPLKEDEILNLYKKDLLFTLEDLFKINSETHFVLELKSGTGSTYEAFQEINRLIQQYNVKNFIVDAFSYNYLKLIKEINPNIKTSLHTKFIYSNFILETTYEKPFIKLHKVQDLPAADIFTLSYKTSLMNIFNLDIDTYLNKVFKHGKTINFGAVKSVPALQKILKSNVNHIYLRSKEVLNHLGFK